ncbi:MAG TPA: hypothetical protein PK990_07810 [Salinivirgaceae bacterium]|nr:hypothetical protein [Salinivirgaceae bacterium]
MNDYTLYSRLKKLTPAKFLNMVEKKQVRLKQPNPELVAKTIRKISTLKSLQENPLPANFSIKIIPQ